MKPAVSFLAAAVVSSALFLVACRGSDSRSVQADVDAAIARGDYQFIGLVIESDGKIRYPQVPGVPEWYFSVTGMSVRTVRSEPPDAELEYVKRYNDTLYAALKAQGKFSITREEIAKAKATLVKRQTRH